MVTFARQEALAGQGFNVERTSNGGTAISGAPTVAPTVITSNLAQDHLNDITTQHADIVSSMANQAQTVSANKATADEAARVAKETADKNALEQAKINAKNKLINVATDSVDGANELDQNKTDLKTTSDEYYAKAKNVTDTIDSINSGAIPLNAAEQAQVDGLKQQFGDLIKAQGLQNISAEGSANTRGYQTGSAEYDPDFQVNTIGNIATAGINKVADLNIKMASAVATLTNALKTQKISDIKTSWDVYQTAAKDRMAALQKTITDTSKAVSDARKTLIQSSRDNAIAGIISQGVTNPTEILNYLNNDAKGNQIGDFTADEVSKAVKALAPENDLDKLSGATRDFYILKAHGQLPQGVTSLPENQQMFAYLKQLKAAETLDKPTGTGTKITLSTVKTLGLPLSTVGMSQQNILDSLQSEKPPAWFVEKLSNQLKMSVTPEATKEAWEDYRKDSISKAEGDKPAKVSANYTKAKQYFGSTYDGLADDQLDAIATEVETYVNGGMSYAKAVAQTEKDISGK